MTKFEAEKDLYAQIAGGNEQAFNQFFLLHTDALLGYLLKITKSDIWAEELIQEVWVQFWTNRSHISQLENPLSYLYTIARNKAFDWIRKNKTELKWMMSNHFQAENPHQNLTEQQFSFKQLQEVVQSAVASLPTQRRKIYELKTEGNLSYDQIAQTLNISKHTVRNQMAAALAHIRCILKAQGSYVWILFCYLFF